MKRSLLLLFSALFLLLPSEQLNPASAAPHYDTAYDIINGVNILRLSSGLPELEVNQNLMNAAQAQSDYQASTKTVTHLNADGETVLLQAAKFGYGDGQEIIVASNVYGAFQASAVTTISSWAERSRDLQNMLDPHTHIGAGSAINNGVIYYTLIVAHLANDPGTGTEAPTDIGTDPLFIVATPRADGSIVHIVGFGHTLILIAEKYETTVENIMLLNNLSEDSVIFLGQELIIQLPETGPTFTPSGPTFTPTSGTPASPTLTPTPTTRPTRTPRPTRTLSSQEGGSPSEGSEPTPTLAPPTSTQAPLSIQSMGRVVLIALIIIAAILVMVGNLLDRRKSK